MFNIIEWLYFKQKNNLALNNLQFKVKNSNYWEFILKPKLVKKDCYITMIDINGLKKYNDNFGHDAGDQLIRKFIYRIEKNFKGVKHTLILVHGDEYILATAADPKVKLMQCCYDDIFSYGTYHKREYTDINYAIKLADKRMYEHKKIIHSKMEKKEIKNYE